MFVGSFGTSTGTEVASRIGKRRTRSPKSVGGPADGSLSAPRRTQFCGPGMKCRPSSVGTAGTSPEATSKTLKELSAPKFPMTYGAGYLAKLRREAPQKVRNPFVPAAAASRPLCPSHAHSGSQPLTCLKRRTFREPHSSVRKAPLQGLGIESEARPRQYDWRTLQLTTTGLRVTLPESAGSRD